MFWWLASLVWAQSAGAADHKLDSEHGFQLADPHKFWLNLDRPMRASGDFLMVEGEDRLLLLPEFGEKSATFGE